MVALCSVPALVGCSSGDPYDRVPVSGSVTFQGQPVVDGQIRFGPQRGTKSPVVIEPIRDGRYATTTSGGVPEGRYHVEIRAYDPNAPVPKTMSDPPRRQLLPAKWNARSKLELVVESGQGEITRDFDLAP